MASRYQQPSASDIQRFLSHFQALGPDECWVWKSSKTHFGYGHFYYDGKYISAHRFSLIFQAVDVPDDACVLHRCDNPSCVNPNHLFLGTRQDNMDDRNSKGRQSKGDRHRKAVPKGEECSFARLTSSQVKEVRRRYAARIETQKSMADRLKVNPSHISRICSGKNWKSI